MDLAPEIIILLTLLCVCSGIIDAIAGGGGLLTVPALLFAGVPPVQALATNKLQSVFGTTVACINFYRAGLIDLRANLLTVVAVFVCACAGTVAVQMVRSDILELVVPALLLIVAGYVLLSPRMTDIDSRHYLGPKGYAPVGGAIGFYDGFFGPGTGSFFSASLVALRGHGLTRATALSKLFNVTSNIAAVTMFALGGKMLWLLGLCMAAGAITGGFIGSHLAMRFGARLIRPLLVIISVGLTGRLIWGYFAD